MAKEAGTKWWAKNVLVPIVVALIGAGGITALVKSRGKTEELPPRSPTAEPRSDSSPRRAEAANVGVGYRFVAKFGVVTELNRHLRIPAVAHVSRSGQGESAWILIAHADDKVQPGENVSLSSLRARIGANDILMDELLTPARTGRFAYGGRRFSVSYVSDASVVRDGVLITVRTLE
jgi:hypothetical protein